MSGGSSSRPLPIPKTPSRRPSEAYESSTEKENQSPKVHRPHAALKDSRPADAPVPVSSFYAGSSKPRAGTSHTTYIPPTSSPPPSQKSKDTSYREPELVDDVPPLEPIGSDWGNVVSGPWDWNSRWGTNKVDIDGRNDDEELKWSDPDVLKRAQRPGPGMLAPVLFEILHSPDHTLYSVRPTAPPVKPNIASSSSPPPPPPVPSPPPTSEELHTAVPHPNAYYCKEHNGWVLLSWCSSSVLPPISPMFKPEYPFPEQSRRKLKSSCTSDEEQSFGKANMTHHFHRYAKAVDASKLTTPFKRSEWEAQALRKQQRRKMTLHLDEDKPDSSASATSDSAEPDLLDLYICCQCMVYCLVSQVIPGVLPIRVLEEFVKDKYEHPPPGKTGDITVVTGFETIITILENRLWRGEHRVLPVTRPKFQSKLGWNGSVRRVFDLLDFQIDAVGPPTSSGDQALHPPSIDPASPEGKRTRAKLLRAWVEIGSWLSVYNKQRPMLADFHGISLHVHVESATDMIQNAIGAHISQISRGSLPEALLGYIPLDHAWETLGMASASYSPDLLAFAYLAQCRCNPAKTVDYFSSLSEIVETMKEQGIPPPDSLEMLLGEEKSRGRFTWKEVEKSLGLLGFGKDNILGIDLEDADDVFLIRAWKEAMNRIPKEADAVSMRVDLVDAFKIVADLRGSTKLQEAWEKNKSPLMTLESAYHALEVPKDVDETMLLTIFNMRVEDQPSQGDRMREALTVIAQANDSERIKQFLETGRDPGDLTSQSRLDMPRGLNQLGNTCYLNSLLQYFYTIKDLRDAVTPLGEKSADVDKFTDDDLKRHRVGGRNVTRREVVRSKKFVDQLADLFHNLEHSDQAAVTPTMDLAKLALVTTQDEEEDDQGGAGTDASNDTDATLVDDGPVHRSSPSPIREPTSPSVLGKRNRGRIPDVEMEGITTIDEDKDYVVVSKSPSPKPSPGTDRPTPERKASSSKRRTLTEREDVVMKDVHDHKAPPLPPRKAATTSDSTMMFGRQHDVSECMDNCMFQIETALLDFQDQGMSGSQSDKTSVIKRVFYGKKRQRLTPLTEADAKTQRSSSAHEKEDLFSHLHLNVSDESFDLYDGLSRYFDDIVELDGAKKRMEVTLVDLPPLLQIQLQRVQFDRETQQAYKSQAYVKFGDAICMDRFLDSADPEKRAKSKDIQLKLNASRDRIQRLTQGKHAPFAPALGAAADFLSQQNRLQISEVSPDLIAHLKNEQSHVASQLDRERESVSKMKQQLEDIWKNDSEAVYQLTSVFIHRGSSPSFGHYFFYSRNLPDHPDQWFKYNDSSVSVVSKDEVFADTTGSTANPYMLVFARKNADVIQTVHRFDSST